MPQIFHEIYSDPLAFAGVMLTVCAMLVFVFPEIIRQTEDFRDIHHYYDELKPRQIQVRFTGEILTVAGRTSNAALIALFWVCHTLRHAKDHIFDNATDLASVIIMAQLCLLLGAAGQAHDMWEWLEQGVEHVPGVEVAALGIFNYVVWRLGAYWKVARQHFQSEVLAGRV
jgi:hypothetical protein